MSLFLCLSQISFGQYYQKKDEGGREGVGKKAEKESWPYQGGLPIEQLTQIFYKSSTHYFF